jgi:hypothetical protein
MISIHLFSLLSICKFEFGSNTTFQFKFLVVNSVFMLSDSPHWLLQGLGFLWSCNGGWIPSTCRLDGCYFIFFQRAIILFPHFHLLNLYTFISIIHLLSCISFTAFTLCFFISCRYNSLISTYSLFVHFLSGHLLYAICFTSLPC